MEIYKLTPGDWEKFKEIRLDALKNGSEAFGSSFEEKVGKSDEEWRKTLEKPTNYIYAAAEGENICGMVAAYQEEGEKVSHIAYIWGVYVKKEYRGKGISQQVMQSLLNELKTTGKIEKINLNVSTKQLPAIKLYESLGFQIAGTLHKEMKINGKFIDEYIMEKLFW